MNPIKPEVCVVGDRLAVFMGADYKMLPLSVAEAFVRKLQSELAKLRRQEKRARRAQRKSLDAARGGYSPASSTSGSSAVLSVSSSDVAPGMVRSPASQ